MASQPSWDQFAEWWTFLAQRLGVGDKAKQFFEKGLGPKILGVEPISL